MKTGYAAIAFVLLFSFQPAFTQPGADCSKGDLYQQHRCLMLKAISAGNITQISKLAKSDYVDINEKLPATWYSYLMYATVPGVPLASMSALLDAGADPNIVYYLTDQISAHVLDRVLGRTSLPRQQPEALDMLSVLLDHHMNPDLAGPMPIGVRPTWMHLLIECDEFENPKKHIQGAAARMFSELAAHGAHFANFREPKANGNMFHLLAAYASYKLWLSANFGYPGAHVCNYDWKLITGASMMLADRDMHGNRPIDLIGFQARSSVTGGACTYYTKWKSGSNIDKKVLDEWTHFFESLGAAAPDPPDRARNCDPLPSLP